VKLSAKLLSSLGLTALLLAGCHANTKTSAQVGASNVINGRNVRQVVCEDDKGAKTMFTQISSSRWELQFEGQPIKHPLHVNGRDEWSVYLWSNRDLGTDKQWIAATQLDLYQKKCNFAGNVNHQDDIDYSKIQQNPQKVKKLVLAE
jgi:hypothetical protein